MEDTNKDQRYGKLPWICKLLPMIHPKLQPHCKTIEQTKGQEELEMGARISEGI